LGLKRTKSLVCNLQIMFAGWVPMRDRGPIRML
jgi:hypothetical protein